MASKSTPVHDSLKSLCDSDKSKKEVVSKFNGLVKGLSEDVKQSVSAKIVEMIEAEEFDIEKYSEEISAVIKALSKPSKGAEKKASKKDDTKASKAEKKEAKTSSKAGKSDKTKSEKKVPKSNEKKEKKAKAASKKKVDIVVKSIGQFLKENEIEIEDDKLTEYVQSTLMGKLFKSKSKEERDPNKPKQPLSIFFAWQNKVRQEIKAANPKWEGKQVKALLDKRKENEYEDYKVSKEYKVEEEKNKKLMAVYSKELEKYNKENNIVSKKKAKSTELKKINSMRMFINHAKSEGKSHAEATLLWSGKKDDKDFKKKWEDARDQWNSEHGFESGKGSGKTKKSSEEEVDEEENGDEEE